MRADAVQTPRRSRCVQERGRWHHATARAPPMMARKGTRAVGGTGSAFADVRTRGEGVERLREDSEGHGENTSREGEGEDLSTSADEEHWRRRRGNPRRHHVPRATTMGSAACAAPGVTGSTTPCPLCLHGARGSSACLGRAQCSWLPLRGLPRTTRASSWDYTIH